MRPTNAKVVCSTPKIYVMGVGVTLYNVNFYKLVFIERYEYQLSKAPPQAGSDFQSERSTQTPTPKLHILDWPI